MAAARDAATSARRRRERQLRSFLRHEELSVKMVLARALHHSAQRVEVPREVEEQVLHAGPRAQKTPPPGMRPASLAEPQGPQERFLQRTVEEFVDLAPMVQILDAPVPQVVEQLADVLVRVDELVKKQEEEEEEVRRWRRTPMNQLTPLQRKKAFEHISKRKRKKRRKRETPKTSSSRAVRTQKSGHSSVSSSWYVYSGGVMSSVACGSSILLGMYWLLQHSANSVLDCAYCWSYGVKVATFIWTWWKTRVMLPSMLAGFAGYDTPCAVFPSVVHARGVSTGAVLGHGDMQVVILSDGLSQTVQKTAVSPQLQSIAGRQHPLRAANADPHGPVCSADHGDSTVAAYFGGRCSCCRVVQILRCCRGEAFGAPTVAARREICDFLRPLVSDSHLYGVRLQSTGFWTLLGDGFWMFPVFSAFWFHIGYMHCVSLRSFGHVQCWFCW